MVIESFVLETFKTLNICAKGPVLILFVFTSGFMTLVVILQGLGSVNWRTLIRMCLILSAALEDTRCSEKPETLEFITLSLSW